MPEKFEEIIKENTPGPDGQPREKKQQEEDPGFFRRYVRVERSSTCGQPRRTDAANLPA